jgi:hypothetical protein
LWFTRDYTVSLQNPLRIHFQWPVVIEERIDSLDAAQARADQHGKRLTAWQQYACRKFGSDCRVALAIQRAENPLGKCEIYHHNSDGTLDWGYFQINTVHLRRPGLNLRDLLDCKARTSILRISCTKKSAASLRGAPTIAANTTSSSRLSEHPVLALNPLFLTRDQESEVVSPERHGASKRRPSDRMAGTFGPRIRGRFLTFSVQASTLG